MTKVFEEIKGLTVGQLAALVHTLGGEQSVKEVLKNQDLAQKVAELIRRHPGAVLTKMSLVDWATFYQEVFNIKVDLSTVKLPPVKEGFDWLVVVPEELGDKPMNRAMAVAKGMFTTWQYVDDLDRDVTTNDRHPRYGSYAIRVRNRVEADEENKNFSANQAKEKQLAGITLLERILLEIFYFWRTQKHLDRENWTICAGSRYFDDGVPRCHWHDDKFRVYWSLSGNFGGALRARSVVS